MFNFQSGEIMEQSLPRRLLETELVRTPSEANRTADPYYLSEMNFDTNMVVIMAALLCALIGALGVNSIVRCVMRCSHRFGMEGPEEAAARLAATGLKKRDLGQIPVVVYGTDANIKGTECPICLGEFEEGDKVRMLPICNHGFHVGCIDTWLRSHSSCPNCRHSLLERPTKVERYFEEAAVSQPPPESASSQQGSVAVVIASGN